ncbi:hypothetical protein DRN73_07960 [Candidatus Pacearchaeota archaeon]|nr:MAG: hypothetical protein DRN73_07960 [Candidatus Pacearchaeota archaeon]
MGYQIPQQLEYQEKIVFGLTFKQLIYGLLFSLISIFFFKRVPWFFVQATLISFSVLLGIGFMFFNLNFHIRNYWFYLRFRKLTKDDPELRKFFKIKDIKRDFLIKSNNKKIAILKVIPINFKIKPENQQEAIMHSFQKFLNSLDFPIQIIMNTQKINLNSFLDKLENKDYEVLLEDYKACIRNTIQSNKIVDRAFYLVVEEKGDLDIQIELCEERLKSFGLKTQRLGKWGIFRLLRRYLASDVENTTKNNKMDRFLDKVQRFLKKLEIKKFKSKKIIETTSTDIYPNNIVTKADHLELNQQYQRVIHAIGYPRTVEAGFLDKIISSFGNFDLSIHITPYPIEKMLIGLNRELQKQRADLFAMKAKGIINPSLEIQHKDTLGTLEDLQKGEEKLFTVNLYISCRADSKRDLDLLTKRVESELNSLMILPKVSNFRALHGLKSILPLGEDLLSSGRNIGTKALSAFFPFTSRFLDIDESGIWLGMNKNGIPIIKDIFNLSNPNGLVLAQSGGGKSYFCKLLITRYLMNGTKVMVIDPQGEYSALVSKFKGQRIDLSRDSNSMINPLDLMGHNYVEKRLSLMDLMKIMLGDLSEPQKAFIDKAITNAYLSKGIDDNPSTWGYEPPILEDILKSLWKLEKRAIQLEKNTLRSLINRLDMYVSGVFSFMNQHTNIKFSNDFVCFDIGSLPSQVKPSLMFLVLDYVYMKMKSNLDRKILLIDEAWSLLSRSEDAHYIFEIVKTCRKFNLGLLLINQEVDGLLNSNAGKSVLANSAYTLLMKQKPAVIDKIARSFHLSDYEKTHLLTAGIGEGLLIIDDDHQEIKVISSPEEHKVITTKPEEVVEDYSTQIYKKINIDLDESKGYFKKKGLKKDEIKYLVSKKYTIIKKKGLMDKKVQEYLIKPRFNESDMHCFVTYDIANYLESKGMEVKLYVTKNPDIIFKLNGKNVAIEIETGTKIKKDKKMVTEKVKELKKNYDEGVFVLTDNHNIRDYRKLMKTFELRSLKGKIDKMLK